ncbi:Fic/DOC family protein [Rhodococcus koreensis]|uniref:Fic/DOC family protein n=1 Tax=Rhodococcus koreensis TaxID=99653 RepID=UPI00366E28C4
MTPSGRGTALDNPYYYSDTQVLRNLFGYTDPRLLSEVESAATTWRLAELAVEPVAGDFGFTHLQDIHYYLLQDVYEWAGEIRTVRSFAGNTGIEHDSPESIEAGIAENFANLAAADYLLGLDHAEFTTALAEYWGDLTLLHPFVDGNSRTQKVFVDQLAHQAGWAIDWREINVGALQSARTFSFVDQGKILGDILGPVIVEKDSIPVDVVAAPGRDALTTVQEHWVAMIEHAENRFDEPYTWSTQHIVADVDHQPEPTPAAGAEHRELPEYESSWQQPYWIPDTGHNMTIGHTMSHPGSRPEGPRL